MKKFGVVLVALAAMLVLPGSAKADSITYTGASGSAIALFGLSGSGSFSASSLGPGSQSFSFTDTLFTNSITIGSGASAFNGVFTGGFTNTGVSCGFLCTQWTANFTGTGASAGEIGSIVLNVSITGQILSGSADPGPNGTGVPEPGTVGMFAVGLAGIGLMISRRTKALQASA